RLMATIPVMGVVAIAVFALLHITPGDPAVIIAGDYATSDDIARIRAKLGLNEPFVTQVGIWLGRIVRGDLGTSIFSGLPVSTLIRQRTEATIGLTLFAMLISVGVGVPLGVLAAWKKASLVDRLVMLFAVSGFSMGLAPRRVLIHHALKNASWPVVTIIGIGFALLIGGAVVTESVFALPGLGRLTVDAIIRRDSPVIQGVILVVSGVYVLINLVVDVLYVVLDPRIRY